MITYLFSKRKLNLYIQAMLSQSVMFGPLISFWGENSDTDLCLNLRIYIIHILSFKENKF